jgi:RNA polymerase sigma-70 factor (ECF subfamily)
MPGRKPEPSTVDDAALARRAAEADRAAEEELCKRLFPRVRAYCRLHVRDDAARSDLAQHVLLVLIEALRAGKLADPDRLASFAMGICRNTLLDWRKGEQRRAALLERFGPSFASVVEPMTARLDRDKLVRCLESLDARERTVVALTFFAEEDSESIARELTMTLGHVRLVRHRALAHLHDCLNPAGAS